MESSLPAQAPSERLHPFLAQKTKQVRRWTGVESAGRENDATEVRRQADIGRDKLHVFAGGHFQIGNVQVSEHGRGGFGAVERYADRIPIRHGDRKSTRLNSSHITISYAVF